MSGPALEAITSRIALPEATAESGDPGLTGELAGLVAWWRTVAGAAAVAPRWIEASAELPGSALEALTLGAAEADRAIDAGANLLVPRALRRDDVAARVLISVLARVEPQSAVPQSPGRSDREWMSTVAEVRDRSADLAELRGDLLGLLDRLPGPGIAFCAGVLLGSAARRTGCIVDGTDELAAALVADRLSVNATSWWVGGSTSPDPARSAAVDRTGLRPGLPLALSDDDGWGARCTLSLLELTTDPAR